jgi:spore coat polysaccharide biosynthesis protein SpsF (cytidylyltransferase family)
MEVVMRVVGIIQARMGSSRFPGKVMMPLGSKIVIDHVVSRLSESKKIDLVVVATSLQPQDDIIENWCHDNEIQVFRGAEQDVLDRYQKASEFYNADVVVRITADCPFIDPEVVDKVIEGFFKGGYDAFGLGGDFPDGLDCQVFSKHALQKAWSEATLLSDREHVGSYIENTNPSGFNSGSVELFEGLGFHRWTLDEDADYIFLTKLIDRVVHYNKDFRTADLLLCLEEYPDLLSINSSINRNEGYWSMRGDEKEIPS